MQAVARSIILVLVLAACARVSGGPRELEVGTVRGNSAALDAEVILWQPCTRADAERYSAEAKGDLRQALQGAACYVFLLREEPDRSAQLEDAKRGLKLAETAASEAPQSGLAHYLMALLTGLRAERDPLNGLAAVPVIEREAQQAARLSPELDHGGPDRILGELYLRAPEPPISIGDSSKAVAHYRRAVQEDPRYTDNRLGLAESLMADDEPGKACEELTAALEQSRPAELNDTQWGKALALLRRLCRSLGKRL